MAVENKNIFITGSTDGIGKMLAIEFAKKGANIIAHGRNSKTLDNLYDSLEEQGNGKHLIIEADLKYLNDDKSFNFMKEAAENDNAWALNNLGVFYEMGRNTKKDMKKCQK